MKKSYAADMVLSAFDTPFRKKCTFAGIVIFAIYPFLFPPFFVHISNLIGIACIGAMALNLVTGTAGLLSLGHAGFMCAGAFTVGILASHLGMPIWITLPAAGLVGAILGLLSGFPSVRLKGVYLGVSTLAIHYIIYYLANEYQFSSGSHYQGFHGIHVKDPSLGIFVLSGKTTWYFFIWFFVCLTGIFIANMLRSRPGRAWVAIRDQDIAAGAMGINVGWHKVLAFILSSAIISMSGGLYAYYTNLASVEEYSFHLTVSYLAMIIVGGIGSVLGSIMGAFLITLIPYLLIYLFGFFEIPFFLKDYFYALESGVFGVLIIIFMVVEPLGLVEIWRRVRTFFEFWPFKYKPLMITKR
jgi:branched-chain amino acid transport system permease protein